MCHSVPIGVELFGRRIEEAETREVRGASRVGEHRGEQGQAQSIGRQHVESAIAYVGRGLD